MVVELGREPFELHLFQKSFIQGVKSSAVIIMKTAAMMKVIYRVRVKAHRRFNEVRLAKVSAFMHSILFALINSSWDEALFSR